MRQNAQKMAQQSRERNTRIANKRRKHYSFRPGDRVYKIRGALTNQEDRKTASRFQGPYIILERGDNDVYKLANFYTGRVIKNFIHVDKLKSCQSARATKRASNADRAVSAINRDYKPQSGRCAAMRATSSAALPRTKRTATARLSPGTRDQPPRDDPRAADGAENLAGGGE